MQPRSQHGLIFAKQFEARNDILREEVCHFWTVHSAPLFMLMNCAMWSRSSRCDFFPSLRAERSKAIHLSVVPRYELLRFTCNDARVQSKDRRHEQLHDTNDAAGGNFFGRRLGRG
jgi:hypothetical protein